jgi:hypothetical protein
MRRVRCLAATWLLSLLWTVSGHAELFEMARQAIRTDVTQMDATGVNVRGGFHLTTGQSPQNQTLFRGQASTGGTCGAFDFRGSMQQALEELPEMMTALLMDVGQALPLLAICYLEPTWCDNIKHWQAYLNAAINARYAQCQSIQNAMAYGGLRLRGGATSQCLEEATGRGEPIAVALRQCEADLTTIRRPDGTQGVEANLVRDTLAAAGAPEETLTLANSLLGEVTLQSGEGRLRTQSRYPQATMLAYYEAHKAEVDAKLRSAIEEYQASGRVSNQTLQAISVPGKPTPPVAVETLAFLQADSARYEALLGKLTTQQAIVRLTWDCHELEERLRSSVDGNQHLTDEARRLLESQVKVMQQNLLHMSQKAEAAAKLDPVFDELLRTYTAMQAMATQAGIHTPALSTSQGPYRRQTPIGYAR